VYHSVRPKIAKGTEYHSTTDHLVSVTFDCPSFLNPDVGFHFLIHSTEIVIDMNERGTFYRLSAFSAIMSVDLFK
jgi:hypothetical protein